MGSISDSDFIEVCNSSESMRQAFLKINYCKSFTSFIKRAKKLNCYKTNQFWSRGKTVFTDSRIRSKNGTNIFIENSNTSGGQLKKIVLSQKLIEYKCKICGCGNDWCDKILILQLDHINGIRNDNRLENLRFLCPNCHSQTETFCSINKNSKKFTSYSNMEIVDSFENGNGSISKCLGHLGIRGSQKNRFLLKEILTQNGIQYKKDTILKNIENKKREKRIKMCECGDVLKSKSKRCMRCSLLLKRKVKRPSLDDLKIDISEIGYCATGRKYGVSDNAIRKWIRNYENEMPQW